MIRPKLLIELEDFEHIAGTVTTGNKLTRGEMLRSLMDQINTQLPQPADFLCQVFHLYRRNHAGPPGIIILHLFQQESDPIILQTDNTLRKLFVDTEPKRVNIVFQCCLNILDIDTEDADLVHILSRVGLSLDWFQAFTGSKMALVKLLESRTQLHQIKPCRISFISV